jgi:signal transduction histidine kinase
VTGLVLGDALRLQQVLSNLLGNAIKFTPTGGQVTLTVSEDADELCLCVTDTGIGITAAVLPHVFEPFQQAERSSVWSHHGLGLGLAIV